MAGFTMAMAAGIAAVGMIGVGAYAVSQQKKQTDFTPPPAPAAPDTDVAKAAAAEAITKKKRAVARNRTVYTGPLGISDEEKSGLATKTMLGQ